MMQVCKARMLPLWHARWLSLVSCLASTLQPLRYCLFGVLVAVLPALLGLFTVQLLLPLRYSLRCKAALLRNSLQAHLRTCWHPGTFTARQVVYTLQCHCAVCSS